MKVLLDENVPHRLRPLLVGHDVFTVAYLGWAGTKNGALLRRAAEEGFGVIVTLDDGVPYEQNLKTLPIAVLVLTAPSSDLDDLQLLVQPILDALRVVSGPAVFRVP